MDLNPAQHLLAQLAGPASQEDLGHQQRATDAQCLRPFQPMLAAQLAARWARSEQRSRVSAASASPL